MRKALPALAALVAGLLLISGTQDMASAQEPDIGSGADLFQQRCATCHNARGFGTRVLSRRVPEGQAELEKRENLTAPFVMAVVRNGIGSMPQIRVEELDDERLARIAAYLEGNDR